MKLLHFTAEWCQPCKMMKPIVLDILSSREDIQYISIDIDEKRSTAMDWGIMGVPTFILTDNDNNIISRVSGAMTKQKFIEELGL